MLNTLSAWLRRVLFDNTSPPKSEEGKMPTDRTVSVWTGAFNADWGNPANWSSRPPAHEAAVRLDCWASPTN
jgi:hypothetical protein